MSTYEERERERERDRSRKSHVRWRSVAEEPSEEDEAVGPCWQCIVAFSALIALRVNCNSTQRAQYPLIEECSGSLSLVQGILNEGL